MTDQPGTIPVLSLADLPMSDFSAQLGVNFRTYGFAIVRDHGIDPSLINRGWRLTQELFALSEETKRTYQVANGAGQRGYTGFGMEIARGAERSDLKEFWHVGREQMESETLPSQMPANVWPQELPEFRQCFTDLYRAFERIGIRLLEAIALGLKLPRHWFADPVHQGNSILRLLHYPPLDSPMGTDEDGAIRAQAHEDINLITLLLGAEEAGLQLLSRDGRWIDISPPPGALVVNIGDMLQRLTNNILPSTTHRVVNPPSGRRGRSRYSMPFFLHLRPDFIIDPLPQCIDASNPTHYPPISADDYLHERLREIGLISPTAA